MIAAAAIVLGCAHERTFTNLGDGTVVPTASVEAYAREHGLTREQAREAMLAEDRASKAQLQTMSSDAYLPNAARAEPVLLPNRYHFSFEVGPMQYYLTDTATGQVWRLSRRGERWEPLPPLPAGE